MKLQELWAKTDPFQSVCTHGIAVGIIAQVFYRDVLAQGNRNILEKYLSLSENQVVPFLGYWASVHDIGKIDYMFQCKDFKMKARLDLEGLQDSLFIEHSIRHEKTSTTALKRIWKEAGMERRTRNLFAEMIGAHHQGKTGGGRRNQSAQWCTLQTEFECSMRMLFLDGELYFPKCREEHKGIVSALLLGILILADWIASGNTFYDAETLLTQNNGIQRLRERAEHFFDSNGFAPSDVAWEDTFCGIWRNIPEEGRRPLQTEIENLFQNTDARFRMILVEAPMGEGKTEAGMYAALQMQKQWKKSGFYIALPTSATSNQMVGRMRDLMEMHGAEDTVRLLHAMAWLVDEHTPEEDYNQEDAQDIRSWLAPVRRGLLSPYAVGTVDQAMLAATQVKYGVLRLLGLSNKVLVIDEIHSYDVYMDEIILRLLEWCIALEIPVVMLSATLPADKKTALFNVYGCKLPEGRYPSITAVLENGSAVFCGIPATSHRLDIRTSLSPCLNDAEAIANMAIMAVREGGCLCVLMNTIREAQEVYRAVRAVYTGKLLLFHAQFPAARREEIERECLTLFGKDKSHRPEQAILVATQVVEQSLDVDFDGMITAVAPMDLLLQRLGRVHRHANTNRPKTFMEAKAWILVPEKGAGFGVNGIVYPACLLRQSIHLLKERERVVLPDDIQQLVQDGYDNSKILPEEMKAWFEMLASDSVKAAQSQAYLLSHPWKEFSPLWEDTVFNDEEENSYLSVKTRLSEPNVRIALVEAPLYQELLSFTVQKEGKRFAPVTDRKLAQEVLSRSVSVREKRIKGKIPVLLDIMGDKLLAGVEILPAVNGVYQDHAGMEIRFDPELGVIIKEGEI